MIDNHHRKFTDNEMRQLEEMLERMQDRLFGKLGIQTNDEKELQKIRADLEFLAFTRTVFRSAAEKIGTIILTGFVVGLMGLIAAGAYFKFRG